MIDSNNEKRIVITGVSSFVGCHLALGFSQSGWRVIAVTRKPHAEYDLLRRRRFEWIGQGIDWATLDIKEEKATRQFIRQHRPNVWVHHAGYANNYHSLDYDLEEGQAINVAPLQYIYEELTAVGCRGIIITGSSMEYSDGEKLCMETDFCSPTTPYGFSKLTETLFACHQASRWSLPTRVVRLFVPFGVLDAPQKLIYYVYENLQRGRAVDLSPCTQKRDVVYIDDVVEAYRLLAQDLDRKGWEIFNICSGTATPIKDIVQWIADGLGAPSRLLRFGVHGMRKGEPMVSYGCAEKAQKQLGWKPRSPRTSVKAFLKDMAKFQTTKGTS